VKTLEGQLTEYGAHMRDLHGPLEAPVLDAGVRHPVRTPGSRPRRRSAWLAAAAAASALIAFGMIGLFYGGGASPGVGDAPMPSSTTGAADLDDPAPVLVTGMPSEGATPTDPAPVDLVLAWSANVTVQGSKWVFTDGRLISAGTIDLPSGAGEGFIGLTERRLTPQGVEYLRAEALSTGLLADDLVLAREGNAPYMSVRMATEDGVASLTWAWRGIAGDAPVATAEQESALRSLNALFANSRSWPLWVWDEEEPIAFVPSEYVVCLGVMSTGVVQDGGWVGPVDPMDVWALLPPGAEDLLRTAAPAESYDMHGDAGCSRLATGDAMALAGILQEAGLERTISAQARFVGFELPGQAIVSDRGVVGGTVFIQFGPVLPDGEAVWLGPG